jgi:hypothetical protein
VSEIVIDSNGMRSLGDYVERRAGRVPAQWVDESRMSAPIESGALKASGRVTKRGRGQWRVSFGEGLPDARAVYQEVGTGSHFSQPMMVDTDFSPLWSKREHRGIRPQGYIRRAVYRDREF